MDRFFELKDASIKKKLQKEEREKQVFGINNSRNYKNRAPTIPKPFVFSKTSESRKIQYAKIKEEIHGKEERECTFRPSIPAFERKKIIDMILEDSFDE